MVRESNHPTVEARFDNQALKRTSTSPTGYSLAGGGGGIFVKLLWSALSTSIAV